MLNIVLTNPYELQNETEKINHLFANGLEILHIRKPRYSKKEIRTFLNQIDNRFHNRIVLHSHYSLALEFSLLGIHINKRSRLNWIFMNFMVKYFRSINPELQVTTTFTNLSEFKSTTQIFAYILIGPLFNSNYSGNSLYRFNQDDLRTTLESSKRKIFALGGVKANRIELIRELGFDGYVLQSAIWKSTDPINVFKDITGNKSSFRKAV